MNYHKYLLRQKQSRTFQTVGVNQMSNRIFTMTQIISHKILNFLIVILPEKKKKLGRSKIPSSIMAQINVMCLLIQ